MNGRIVISLGLLAIALTIAGSAADGDTTPAAAAEVVAATSGPEAVAAQPSAAKTNEKDSRYNNQNSNSGSHSAPPPPGPLTCYTSNRCFVDAHTTCEKPTDWGQQAGCVSCSKSHTKVDGELYSNSRHCVPPSKYEFVQDDGCESKKGIVDGVKAEVVQCACAESLCNGSSVSSPIAFVTLAVLVITAKMSVV